MIAVRALALQVGVFRLDNLSFQVPTGRYAVLMGKTGCGKSTVLEAIAGLKPIRAGNIILQDREVTNLPVAQRGVGYVPQDLALFPTLTVREHLSFALRLRNWSLQDIDQRVEELATLLGLGPLLHRWPRGLSGGEAQRVALGRAVSFAPGVLLLDEPLSALDEETREQMVQLLRSVQLLTGVTVLHVTHSLREAEALGDLRFRLRDGILTEEERAGAASPEERLRGQSSPRIQQ